MKVSGMGEYCSTRYSRLVGEHELLENAQVSLAHEHKSVDLNPRNETKRSRFKVKKNLDMSSCYRPECL
jgi:hypothetical protein